MNELACIENDGFYSSLKVDTHEQRVAFYNATSAPDEQLRDHINEVLYIRDVCAEPVDVTDDKTGEVRRAVRVIMVDVNGVSYSTLSAGIYNSLKRVFGIFGAPTWENGLALKVKQMNSRERQVLTLVAV